MPKEIERRFLVNALPTDLEDRPSQDIMQFYVRTAGRTKAIVRYRKLGHQFLETVKRGRGLIRQENERPISEQRFLAMWPRMVGQEIIKRRYRLPADGGRTFELDVYSGRLRGLLIVELEFTQLSEAKAFRPPTWFGREVTDCQAYSNYALAVNGLPPDSQPATGRPEERDENRV